MGVNAAGLRHYQQRWGLTALAEPFATPSSSLQQVRLPDRREAMLKLTTDAAEQRGGQQLLSWQGNAAAVVVYAHAPTAFLLALAPGAYSVLQALGQGGMAADDGATQILGRCMQQLHGTPLSQFTDLMPLSQWFADLWMTKLNDVRLLPAQRLAEVLLAEPQSCVSLHGDGHHDNVLRFGQDDWRAIDPKGLQGEHYFDYVPILANPDLGALAQEPQRFTRQLGLVCAQQDLDPQRLAQWVAVTAALSAVWFLEDGDEAKGRQQLSMMALALSY
ncbi:MAG: hypothetical protein KBC57_07485 [Neisseriaceae bacterium]|nr:hypothetical protein [Neisseriaceae bacterium]